jgi:aspartyl-tRNA(Asn)/glutamyl-tRNA(Gln) amidotransferase subunit C
MSRITRGEVERMAGLARLSLADEEAERLTGELDTILDYVDALAAVDTTDVEPTSHPMPLATPLREDRAELGLVPDAALRNAPDAAGTTFRVPKVIEGGEA